MALPPRIDRNSHRADKRRKAPAHCAWVRGHACCVCGTMVAIECAHVRNGTDGGAGMKPSDRWTISLCRDHHSEQHRVGEESFQALHRIDMKALAEEFARKSPHRAKLDR